MSTPVAAGNAVIGKITSTLGVRRRPADDTAVSYAFGYRDPIKPAAKEYLFFIPHELHPAGYTQAQVEEIERSLACLGIDLLPLDPYLH